MEPAEVHNQIPNPDGSRGTIVAALKQPSKICTLWVHDEQFSKEDVLVNGDFLSDLRLAEGTLLSISAIGRESPPANAQSREEKRLIDDQDDVARFTGTADRPTTATSRAYYQQETELETSIPDDGHPADKDGHPSGSKEQYLCYLKPTNPDIKARNPNLQVCKYLGLEPSRACSLPGVLRFLSVPTSQACLGLRIA